MEDSELGEEVEMLILLCERQEGGKRGTEEMCVKERA